MTDISEIKSGTPVRNEDDYFGNTYGILTREGDQNYFVSFLYGFPSFGRVNPKDLVPVSKELLLSNLEGIAATLKAKSSEQQFTEVADTQSLLYSAFISRQANRLSGIIKTLEGINDSESIDKAIKSEDESGTGTGVYVARGIYSGQGPSKHFAGVRINPRVSEREASKMLWKEYPEGLEGFIPEEVRDTVATSHGDLVAYNALEIPKSNVCLVRKYVSL